MPQAVTELQALKKMNWFCLHWSETTNGVSSRPANCERERERVAAGRVLDEIVFRLAGAFLF